MRGALRPQMAMKGRPGFAGFGGIGLGTPDPTGEPQSFIWHSMVPGACCYDSSRPASRPSWLETDAELACLASTNNCSAATMKPTPPPTSACAGTIGVDATGNWTCTQVASANDPNDTQGQLSTNGDDFQSQYQAWIDAQRAGASAPSTNMNQALLAAAFMFGAIVIFGR